MKISYNWLKRYINIDIKPAELATILTSIGLEVGGIEDYESVKGCMKGLIIGEIKTKTRHPNADKLSLTTVDIGQPDLLHIVCGAPNVEAGQRVIVATVGTTLYKGEESMVLKETRIRGEISQGMICAEDEIGFGTSHAGIIVLPSDVPVGISAKDYFKVENDVVFEIEITPNRIDAASHIGVARDLAAFLKTQYTKPGIDNFKVDDQSNMIPVIVENNEACPRYSGITISGVEIKESPEWLKNRLKAIRLNPINNVVDSTNFILHETGQPLHAFDADKIKGKTVVVKTLSEDTAFVTLDGIERKLSAQDLMICHTEGGMCMAGVYGGLHSGVSESTKNIFLESACFNPKFIRRTSKKHGLSTDASFRFERGTDPEITVYALKRAAMLIRETAGGKISSEIADAYPQPVGWFNVELNYANTDKLIGKKIERETIKNILRSLEIHIEKETENGLSVSVPPYRVDVRREADVIEEILRIYGYNNIEIPTKVTSSLSFSSKPDHDKMVNMISDYLSANGFSEIICNSLTKSEYYELLTSYKKDNLVYIMNPLSSDLNCMRQTLLAGGLESVLFNINRKNRNLKLYEFGNCYRLNSSQGKNPLDKYSEAQHLALFITGSKSELNWTEKETPATFYQIKAFVENIFKRLGFNLDKFEKQITGNDVYNDILTEGFSYRINNHELAFVGSVDKKLLKSFDIEQEVFYADIFWTEVFALLKPDRVKFSEIPKYPDVRRDLALFLDKHISFDEIKNLAFRTEKKLLKKVNLFDVYEGHNLGDDKKSYAVSFILQDENKTLTDKQIDAIMASLMSAFEKELGAKIR
ncbi:MAG: phenylalanine--tRNA ligase subunit beta [Bacteroidia bacterium]|nr:phenylalanine--tRNA ligase subunit beta [Bacteroidia bacterium]